MQAERRIDADKVFIDPYGIYSYLASGYPAGETEAPSPPCSRYSVSGKGGHPQYP